MTSRSQSMKTNVWWRKQHCRNKRHHHTRDRRYCYWPSPVSNSFTVRWHIRDRFTGRTVVCRSLREVRVWLRAAAVLQPTAPALLSIRTR